MKAPVSYTYLGITVSQRITSALTQRLHDAIKTYPFNFFGLSLELGNSFLLKSCMEEISIKKSKPSKLWRNTIGKLFVHGFSSFRKMYIAYQPDSFSEINAHAEYNELFKRFTQNNVKNNSGDIPRLWSFILNCKQIIEENIPGDFAELGVWRGNTAAILAHYAESAKRKTILFDTFAGFDARDFSAADRGEYEPTFNDTSIELVGQTVGASARDVEMVKGRFPDSIKEEHKKMRYAIVSLDCDLYEPMKAGLSFFYPRLSEGGMLFLHDYSSGHWPGAKEAIDEFCTETGEFLICMPDKSGSAFVRKARQKSGERK